MIVNPKGEMKGSAITGPVAKECVSVHLALRSPVLTALVRRICGRVSRRTRVPSYEGGVQFSFSCIAYYGYVCNLMV